MGELSERLSTHGCTDPEALPLLAKPGLSPQDQLTDLKNRFPAAFPKHARDMTPEQYKTAVKEATKYIPESLQVIEKHSSEMSEREYSAALRKFGVYRRQRS